MMLFDSVSCGSTKLFVANLTSTYLNQSNEASMVAASVIMFVLAGIFFNLNLFSGISDVSAILDPKIRLVLSSALSLLLPVMSYLFSEAKNGGGAARSQSQQPQPHAPTDLTLQAGIILVWMLLVELLRKKVDEIRMQGMAGSLQRAGRVVWLGSLVFFNIHSAGRKIVFAVLWILCATMVVQRIAFTEFGKRSYVHGKNAKLIASYMAHILGHLPDQDVLVVRHGHGHDHDVEHAPAEGAHELLKRCRYIVTGEDQLVKEATPDGYELNKISPATVVTVGDVWSLPDHDSSFAARDGDQRLRRLCLSFALFKLLRRRFEQHEPLTKEEASDGRELIFRGLYDGSKASTEAVFQVITDDVNFLSEYYHSVVPVIFASPFFLLANYALLPVAVFGLCLMTAFLCGNGDIRYALASIHDDNYTIQTGIHNLTVCLLREIFKYPQNFFSLLDLSITFFLFVIFVYESAWELVVFLLSNWFTVSLVCNYTADAERRESTAFRWAFRRILWLRSKMSHGQLSMRQFSVLNLRWPPMLALPSTLSLLVRTRTVPLCVEHSIMEYLVAHDHATPISIGNPVLHRTGDHDANPFSNLSWAFRSRSTAEVILTWHIATSILDSEAESSPSHAPGKEDAAAFRVVATWLSKYCAYLVIFHPELLPDNQDKTESVVEDMKKELQDSLGCLEFYLIGHATRVKRIMKLKGAERWQEKRVVKNGVTLGASILELAHRNSQERVWEMLADVWTELIIYLAPSTDEEHMKGHENALVQGGEFITVLWALTTHTGISRRQPLQGGQD